MKSKLIMIPAILLLSVWAILATAAFVSTEKDNRMLRADDAFHKSYCEKRDEKYAELEAEYAKLEENCEEYQDKYSSEQFTRVTYEWLLDVCANQGNKSYDADLSLERILRREFPWLNMTEIVDEKAFDAVMSVHKQRAKIILLAYDIDIEIK